jgi:transposase-like protein
VRAAIQANDEPGTVLAKRFGVTPQTIYKWRKRDSVEDRGHTPHRYVRLYNQQLPQSALGSESPLQAIKDQHKLKLRLFSK